MQTKTDVVFTGHCLCGSVTFESRGEPAFQANCHCDDCRRSGGGAYASYVFVPADQLSISGETQEYRHVSDRGSEMTKHFCPNCGSPMFTGNSAHPERRGVRLGAIDDASWFRPQADVYNSRKLPSTPVDPDVRAFDKMPG
jgi:hypothetical protein